MGSLSQKIHGKSLGKVPFQVAKQQKSGTDFLDFQDPQAFSLLQFFRIFSPSFSHDFPPIVQPFDTSFTPLSSQGSHEFPTKACKELHGVLRWWPRGHDKLRRWATKKKKNYLVSRRIWRILGSFLWILDGFLLFFRDVWRFFFDWSDIFGLVSTCFWFFFLFVQQIAPILPCFNFSFLWCYLQWLGVFLGDWGIHFPIDSPMLREDSLQNPTRKWLLRGM